ncbi:hypothetical protein [Pseudofulvibacter geojedonensis]|uniref:Uncharacterized protein n=1 Tax=Pseudofulvibacter geojedonensis TaxID=1123758 RepID=A0ABW3HZT5_9FLAO
MKNIITILVLLITCISTAQKKKDLWLKDYVVKEKPKVPIQEVTPFVGEDQFVITYSAGDFNGDTLTDVIAVLGDKKEVDKQRKDSNKEEEIRRPLLILKRNDQGVLELMHKNDSVVYCYMCGSANGSPLTSILFTGNTFAVQHEAGKSNRWTRLITFEFDREKEVWLLKKDATSKYNIMNRKGFESEVKTQDDFGFIQFVNVDVYEDDLIKKRSKKNDRIEKVNVKLTTD